MMQDGIVLRISDDTGVQADIIEHSCVSTKQISAETLFQCIKAGIKTEEFSSGVLPSGTVSIRYDGETHSKYVVLEYSEDKADITYMNTEYKSFPLPRLLFGFTLESSGRISAVKLGVPDTGRLREDTAMYYYPFSNVKRFSLCIGTNSLPNIEKLHSLASIPHYILSFPNNDDRYNEDLNRLKLGHRELLERLKDKDRQYYYDNVLIPMSGTTLKNFI